MVALTHYNVEGEYETARIQDVEELTVRQGDNIVFLATSGSVSFFKRVAEDLKIDFDDEHFITVRDFFVRTRSDVECVLTFKDTLYTSSELATCFKLKETNMVEPKDITVMHVHESEHKLNFDGSLGGGAKTTALEGTPFMYHFTLDDEFPEDAEVAVTLNGEVAPEWLKIEKVAPRKYVINGVPEKAIVGTNKLEIHVITDKDEEENDTIESGSDD